MPQARVFFHVGLGKAASTFLQYRFFPKLRGVRYIQRTQYKRAPVRINSWLSQDVAAENGAEASMAGAAAEAGGAHPILVSREFDQQLERECTRFREALPDAAVQPLIVLRRQDGWLASQYRRHVKNGSPLRFQEFIDVAEDRGLWKRSDALFLPKLQFLEHCFGVRPMVYFHEDLKADAQRFFAAMAAEIGATLPEGGVSTRKLHASYSEDQLKWMRKASVRWFPEPIAHGQTTWLQRRGRLLACYGVLYGSRLLPNAWSGEAPLIEPQAMETVREHYAEDWAACRAYAVRAAVD